MNKRIAFFCDRASPLSHLTSFSPLSQDKQQLFQVYTRGLLDESSLGTVPPDSLFLSLREAIRQAGGGILAAVTSTGAEEHLRIETFSAPDYEPPTLGIRLLAGEAPEPFAIHPSVRSVSTDEFILLPISRDEQEVLTRFIEDLGHLPGDYRTLIANTLRRPGIEVTMRKLEKRLDSLENRLPQYGKGGRRSATWAGGLWRTVILLVLVLNLAALGDLWSKYGSRWPPFGPGPEQPQVALSAGSEGGESSTGVTGEADPGKGKTTAEGGGSQGIADRQAPAAVVGAGLEDDRALHTLERKLLLTWADLPKDQTLGKIYSGHFGGLDNRDWRVASSEDKEAAVYGFAKLFMFNTGIELDDKVLSNPSERSAAKEALVRSLSGGSAGGARMKEAYRVLLAHFSCIAFDQQDGKARIKGRKEDRNTSDVELEYECGKIDPEKVKGFLEQTTQELATVRSR